MELAQTHADAVISVRTGKVGALRNVGVKHSTGRILLFLDADIELTGQWSRRIRSTLEHMQLHRCISGSFVKPPGEFGRLLASWFEHLNESNRNYLGSAHMILLREHFLAIGGFDESLVSGEDSDICRRAKLHGMMIVNDTDLLAFHHGFPSTLSAFFLREWWHGSGDRGWSKVKGSAIVFMVLHVVTLGFFLAGHKTIGVVGTILIAALCLFASAVKFSRESLRTKVQNAFIFYVYFWGRSFSIIRPRSRTSHRQH